MKELETKVVRFSAKLILLITLILVMVCTCSHAQVSINNSTLTVVDSGYSVYIPNVSIERGINLILYDVKAKQDSKLIVNNVTYDIIYKNKLYIFQGIEFTNKNDLVFYLRNFLKEKL